MHHPDSVMPSEFEKRHNAEVSTPTCLRAKMLDSLPTSFWQSPHRVFEPCCGKGGFLSDLLARFNKGLSEAYPDEEVRRRVILEECLFFADINSDNIAFCEAFLDPSSCLKLNAVCADTLKAKDLFGGARFDLVVGNPPYNPPNSTGTGNSIWQHFTQKALSEWLVPKTGHLLFVHPPGWRKPASDKSRYNKLFELITKTNTLKMLSIHGVKDGAKTFKCGTRYDWYLVKTTRPSESHASKVIDETGLKHSLTLDGLEWLPNSEFDRVFRLLAVGGEERCRILYSRTSYGADKSWVSKERTDVFKYPVVDATLKTGPKMIFSSVNDRGFFGVSKVIFGQSGINEPIIDMVGEFGMSENSMAIAISSSEEAREIAKALTSESFKVILKACSFSLFRIDWRVFASFKRDFWKHV